jgi:7-cyano-7-deazaguanine synthase
LLADLIYGEKELTAFTVNYGSQQHRSEIKAAREICRHYRVSQFVFNVDLTEISPSPLTGSGHMIERTLGELRDDLERSQAFVPNRNMILISLAVAYAQSHGAEAVYIAANKDDHTGFPDCREGFFGALDSATEKAAGVRLLRPFVYLRKSEVVAKGSAIGVPFQKTISCYHADMMKQWAHPRLGIMHCGRCDACIVRRDAFEVAGVEDPSSYRVDL